MRTLTTEQQDDVLARWATRMETSDAIGASYGVAGSTVRRLAQSRGQSRYRQPTPAEKLKRRAAIARLTADGVVSRKSMAAATRLSRYAVYRILKAEAEAEAEAQARAQEQD